MSLPDSGQVCLCVCSATKADCTFLVIEVIYKGTD